MIERTARRALFLSLALLALGAVAAAEADPPVLPSAVLDAAPGARYVGGGLLRVLGLRIYHAYYWSADPARAWSPTAQHVLDLHYHRNFTGRQIAERSVREMERLRACASEQCAAWGERMAELFPDTYEGQRLTGVYEPGVGVRYYERGKLLGHIDDPAFGEAFFAIWLSPKTSEPALRERLLGMS